MNTLIRAAGSAVLTVLLLTLLGCAQTAPTETPAEQPAEQVPEASGSETDLYDELTQASYPQWAPAPGYETRQPAKGPHGDEVQILLDPAAEQALANGDAVWPQGSIIAKDIYVAGQLAQIAAMKKTAEGWYWGEWSASGKPVAEGLAIEPCEGCHAEGSDGTLGVRLQ